MRIDVVFLIITIILFIISVFVSNSSIDQEFDSDINTSLEPYRKDIDRVFYINLDKRPDRDNQVSEQLQKYFSDKPIKRLSAILDEDNGEIGCLKSHIMMLKYALDNHPGENILFCEDDLEFIEDPRPYLNKIDRPWDVIMLAHNTFKKRDVNKNLIRLLDTQTASAYLVNGNYVEKLYDNLAESLQDYERTGIWKHENWNDQCWKTLQPKGKWYTFRDRIAKQRESYSNIQKFVVNYGV
jgi:hypothetical protein